MSATAATPRRALPDEAVPVAELWLRVRRAAAPQVPAPLHSDAEVRAWFRDVVLPSREVWVASAGDELVAMMALHGEWVEQLYVAPEHQRQGLGSRLLEVARDERESLALWTFETNGSARAFYERHGFRCAAAPSSDNEEGAPALLYRWAR